MNKNVKGQQALAFVRQRHGLPGGDLDRIKRQQVFLSAVFRKLYDQGTIGNPLRIQRLLGAISKSMLMDSRAGQESAATGGSTAEPDRRQPQLRSDPAAARKPDHRRRRIGVAA